MQINQQKAPNLTQNNKTNLFPHFSPCYAQTRPFITTNPYKQLQQQNYNTILPISTPVTHWVPQNGIKNQTQSSLLKTNKRNFFNKIFNKKTTPDKPTASTTPPKPQKTIPIPTSPSKINANDTFWEKIRYDRDTIDKTAKRAILCSKIAGVGFGLYGLVEMYTKPPIYFFDGAKHGFYKQWACQSGLSEFYYRVFPEELAADGLCFERGKLVNFHSVQNHDDIELIYPEPPKLEIFNFPEYIYNNNGIGLHPGAESRLGQFFLREFNPEVHINVNNVHILLVRQLFEYLKLRRRVIDLAPRVPKLIQRIQSLQSDANNDPNNQIHQNELSHWNHCLGFLTSYCSDGALADNLYLYARRTPGGFTPMRDLYDYLLTSASIQLEPNTTFFEFLSSAFSTANDMNEHIIIQDLNRDRFDPLQLLQLYTEWAYKTSQLRTELQSIQFSLLFLQSLDNEAWKQTTPEHFKDFSLLQSYFYNPAVPANPDPSIVHPGGETQRSEARNRRSNEEFRDLVFLSFLSNAKKAAELRPDLSILYGIHVPDTASQQNDMFYTNLARPFGVVEAFEGDFGLNKVGYNREYNPDLTEDSIMPPMDVVIDVSKLNDFEKVIKYKLDLFNKNADFYSVGKDNFSFKIEPESKNDEKKQNEIKNDVNLNQFLLHDLSRIALLNPENPPQPCGGLMSLTSIPWKNIPTVPVRTFNGFTTTPILSEEVKKEFENRENIVKNLTQNGTDFLAQKRKDNIQAKINSFYFENKQYEPEHFEFCAPYIKLDDLESYAVEFYDMNELHSLKNELELKNKINSNEFHFFTPENIKNDENKKELNYFSTKLPVDIVMDTQLPDGNHINGLKAVLAWKSWKPYFTNSELQDAAKYFFEMFEESLIREENIENGKNGKDLIQKIDPKIVEERFKEEKYTILITPTLRYDDPNISFVDHYEPKEDHIYIGTSRPIDA
jgi:hypothetical protein